MIFTLLLLFVLLDVALVFWTFSRRRNAKSIPGTTHLPGPKGLPLIGSVHELAAQNPWMSFQKWADQYGPMYQCNLGGSNHIWISDEDMAHDLLSKRAAIYSDRPHIPGLIDDNRDSGQYLPLMSKNALWNRQRKFAASIMKASQKASFHGYPELEAKRMMKEFLIDPSTYHTSVESFIARTTCRLAWGTAEPSDELKQRARELLLAVSPTGALGNKLPFVMNLPDWLAPTKAWERRRALTERTFFQTLQEQVRAEMDLEKARPSWTQMFISKKEAWGFRDDLEGAYAVGMHGIAGALTIAAPMQGFCLASCLYPHHFAKLQQEIDRVCGDTPPAFADLPKLPYLRACIRETMRWRPPVPTGIPHQLTVDDVYNGYHLPAKSIIHPFEWGMSRNPKKYPQPNAWNPDRWVDPSYPTYQEPLDRFPTICQYSQFGYGRRICQGMEVAEADLLVGIGAIAWGFDVRKAINPDTGLEIAVPEMAYSELLIAKPKWFQFSLTPRSNDRRRRIEHLYREEDARGSYRPARKYWDEKNPALGWGALPKS